MIIHHYLPFTKNVGDVFVRDGIHMRLRERFPSATIIELPANDPLHNAKGPVGLQGENLQRTNAEADLVVVGGSNLYEGPEWRFVVDLDSIRALRPPIAFIGLGVGSVRGRKCEPLSEKSVAEIRLSHQRACGIAVRDFETVKLLAGFDIQAQMTGCPATFVGNRPMHTGPVRRVVVSAPPLRFLPRRGRRGYFGSSFMLAGFRRVLRALADQNLEFEVIAHDVRDVGYLTPLLEEFQRRPLYFGNETKPYYERYQAADFAICYRLHMAISCLGWGVPFYLLNFDLRTEAFRDNYQIDAITYNAFEWGSTRRLVQDVRTLSTNLDNKAPLFKALESRREDFRSKTGKFYDDLAMRLKSKE